MTTVPAVADSDAPVLVWGDGPVGHLRFNRPRALNAIDLPTAAAFRSACEALAADPALRVVVVSGEGRAFLAGGDVAAMRESPASVARGLIDGMHGGLRILAGLDAPVLASVHGAVAGAGLGVLLACDLAIAAEGTRFSIAYPGIGASADCATTWGLPRVVGLRKAMEIALLNEPFDAKEALRFGIVNDVVPAAELEARTRTWAARLAASAPKAIASLKQLIRRSGEHTWEEHLDAEADAFAACAATADFAEGVAAFLAKRPPSFAAN